MGATDYTVSFDALNYLRVHVLAERGRVVEFTAHGDPHRDLLDAAGRNIDKHWLAGWDPGLPSTTPSATSRPTGGSTALTSSAVCQARSDP